MNDQGMRDFGQKFAKNLRGNETIELIGDVGAGKTTFVKGLARGLGIHEEIQSPTFTLSRDYKTDGDLTLTHYDFYRLNDPGIMKMELAENLSDPHNITIIEWAETVGDILPRDKITIKIDYLPGEGREITVSRQDQ